VSGTKPYVQASVVRKAAVISNAPTPADPVDQNIVKEVHSVGKPKTGTAQRPQVGEAVGFVRKAAGKKWIDPQLAQWPENDFRIFVGNLGNEVTDGILSHAFSSRYPSFNMAKVMKSSRDGKNKGFGFVSLGSIQEGARALKEMQGQYIGHRPCQVKKAATDDRNLKDKHGRPIKHTISQKRQFNNKRTKY
jgi:hypothetical protein